MMVRVRGALWLVLGMLSLSLLLVVLGVYTTARSESLNVSGYISGVILTLGSFLGLLGLRLEENRKQLPALTHQKGVYLGQEIDTVQQGGFSLSAEGLEPADFCSSQVGNELHQVSGTEDQ